MGTIIGRTKTKIRTSEGAVLYRRVTTVRMPNGKLRFPVDYYDATPGTVEVSDKELESLRNPVYKQIMGFSMNMTDGYPFIFQMNDKDVKDNLLEYVLQYRFKSTKSNHTYIVRVEKYIEHTYCLKFFDKANMLSDNKFSLRSGTYEPRTIFYTLVHIMMDVYQKDPKASFFFIGAEDEKDEMGEATRRYRIYRSFVSDVLSSKIFKHHRNNELSLYILVNRDAVEDELSYVQRITDEVKALPGQVTIIKNGRLSGGLHLEFQRIINVQLTFHLTAINVDVIRSIRSIRSIRVRCR